MKLAIEKLVYGGDGLARMPADAKGRRMAVFVPFTLPGEEVEARLLPSKRSIGGSMARAELEAVLAASPGRVKADCQHFGRCGGCQLQHGSYALQSAAKLAVLQETLDRARLGLAMPIASVTGTPWHYRNRIRLQVRTAPYWQTGYLERKSHRFLPVEHCPIAAPLLETALRCLAERATAALAPAGLTEIELFCNHDSSQLTLAAWTSDAAAGLAEKFHGWLVSLQRAVPELRGGAAFSQRSASGEPAVLATFGDSWLDYRVAGEDYRVSTGAFFQVNLHLLDALVERVVSAVHRRGATSVVDLYAGVGLFSRRLARLGATVTAVEAAAQSSADLARNMLEFRTATVVRSTTEAFLARTRQVPEAIVVDPPRSGLGAEVVQQLLRLAAPTLVYLSCDPTTLARDLQMLLPQGYSAESLAMIDLFPQTFHQETLVVLRHN